MNSQVFFDEPVFSEFCQAFIAEAEADICGEHKLGQDNGLLGAAEPQFLYLTFGLHTGEVWLTVRLEASEPPVDDRWGEIVEAPFVVKEGMELGVRDLGENLFRPLPLAPGSYRVRYSALNFGATVGAPASDGESAPPLERYELVFWPCEPRPDAVIKVTSERAAYEHYAVRNRDALEREAKIRATQRAIEIANRNLTSIHANAVACASAGAWEDAEKLLNASWRELALAPWANETGWRARSRVLLQLCSLCALDKSWPVLISLVRAGKDAADRFPADLACRAALARMYGVAILHLRQDDQRESALQMQAGLSALAQRFADDGAVQKILAETSILG